MKRILIADASKASLVMTSEVFKDHFPGVQVVVARTSAECLDLVKSTEGIDAYVIDFDLPDRDGAWTAARVKKQTQTPVLITAFDRPEVASIIEDELAAYEDCLSWLRKPVKAETVVSVAQRFCEGRYRTQRRVACGIPALVEIVMKTTVTRTVKETVKVPVEASAKKASATSDRVKSAASKLKATKKAGPVGRGSAKAEPARASTAKGKTATSAKSATSAKAAPAKVAVTTKTVTKSLSETVTAKVVVPATVYDSSLGGVRVEIDLSPYAQSGTAKSKNGTLAWTTVVGEVLTVTLPPADVIEGGDVAAWKSWQQTRLAMGALGSDPTKGSTLSTLSNKTVKAASGKGDGTSLTLRGRVAWVSEDVAQQVVGFGLELDNANNARRVFEAMLARHNQAKKSTGKGALPTSQVNKANDSLNNATGKTLSSRGSR